MSATLYTRVHAEFATAVTRFGRPMSYVPRGGAAISVKGFRRGMKPVELVGGYEQTDQVIVIGADGVSSLPLKFDRIDTGSGSFTIMHANALMAGELLLGYKMYVRGGLLA